MPDVVHPQYIKGFEAGTASVLEFLRDEYGLESASVIQEAREQGERSVQFMKQANERANASNE